MSKFFLFAEAIYEAGGAELLAFARLFKHIKSCEVCMLEEKGILRCRIYEDLFDAWESTRLKSLKVVLDATESI